MQSREFHYREMTRQGFFQTVKEVFKVLVKSGVSIGGIRPELLFGMMITNTVFVDAGEQLVITSVIEGVHGTLSYHPGGFAFDCRLPVAFNVDDLGVTLRHALGVEFDVVLEATHIHIEVEVRKFPPRRKS